MDFKVELDYNEIWKGDNQNDDGNLIHSTSRILNI